MYLKHWKTSETTLTMESNYLLPKVALPIHLASSLLINVMLSYRSEVYTLFFQCFLKKRAVKRCDEIVKGTY